MIRPLILVVAGAASAATAVVATEKVSRLVFPTSGFSINALDEKPAGYPSNAMVLFLPATDHFSPNVCVRTEPYQGTVEQYMEMSKGQLKALGWSLISATGSKDRFVAEYTNQRADKALIHQYAVGFLLDGKIYTATAQSLESQWKDVGPKLKKCVESLKPETK